MQMWRYFNERGRAMGSTMTNDSMIGRRPLWRGVRWVLWVGLAALLLLPLIAMQFTTEVDWTALDFIVMGTMLALVGGAFELVMRVARSHFYVFAAGVAVAAAFVATWVNLAVGIIGHEGNSVNRVFFIVPVIACIGALLSRLAPGGMARTMIAAAIVQAGTCVLSYLEGEPVAVAFTAMMTGMWLLSAALFDRAARASGATSMR